MKISPISYKTYSFKSCLRNEKTNIVPLGELIHQTSFFRRDEIITDLLLQKYLKENFSNQDEINLVSMGCSSGKELYSYAMMLDDFKGLKLIGVDVSQNAIDEAQKGRYIIDSHYENFLRDESYFYYYGGDYERRCAKKFHNYFHPVGNKEFQLNDGAFENCSFKQGNALEIDKLFKKDSVDILLFRNTLYHLLCEPSSEDNPKRVMTSNHIEVLNDVAKKINRVLKPNGVVAFSYREQDTGIDINELMDVMLANGFEPVREYPVNEYKLEYAREMLRKYNDDSYLRKELYSNIWKKVQQV
ncbi:MAG: methyltransferase domain-containing protein [Candidatus Gastranaerophilales bacterium]|nr:methyltransferase domain-containing protein [Candidatus Gastranaerophilales bacterium]